jgi:uncharacterized protein (TIGR02466 family)
VKKIPFGHSLYEFRCDPELLESAIAYMLNSEINWYEIPDNRHGGGISIGYMDKEQTVPYYHEELFNWLQQCLDEVVADQVPGMKIEICDSWMTRSKFGQAEHTPHTHKNSMLSGVMYFTTHEKTKTVFYRKNFITTMIEKFYFHGVDTSASPKFFQFKETYESASEAGKLIIFPSDIYHSISTHTDMKKTRHTLAFNSFSTGAVFSDGPTARLSFTVKSSREKYLEYINNKV